MSTIWIVLILQTIAMNTIWRVLFNKPDQSHVSYSEHLFYSAMKSTQTKLDAIEFDSNWIDSYLQRRLLNPWNKSFWISINGTDFETNFASQHHLAS